MGALAELKILVPESRELDLFATMLEAEGAAVLRCPLVQILDLENSVEADAWIDRCIAGDFDDLVLLTGEGLRRLFTLAGTRRDALVSAVARLRTVTRGPKPARALREVSLSPGLAATVPTSDGILQALANEDVAGRRIGVQLYPGDGAQHLVDALRARGAIVSTVTPYRYASEAETGQVSDAIRALASGEIGMIAFTATPQIERLVKVAQEVGLAAELAQGMARTPIASIGPIVDEKLRQHGFAVAVRPDSSFHLKPLVRAIMTWRQA
jgi:uroporphyrinogen-III synthase